MSLVKEQLITDNYAIYNSDCMEVLPTLLFCLQWWATYCLHRKPLYMPHLHCLFQGMHDRKPLASQLVLPLSALPIKFAPQER